MGKQKHGFLINLYVACLMVKIMGIPSSNLSTPLPVVISQNHYFFHFPATAKKLIKFTNKDALCNAYLVNR